MRSADVSGNVFIIIIIGVKRFDVDGDDEFMSDSSSRHQGIKKSGFVSVGSGYVFFATFYCLGHLLSKPDVDN